LLDAKLTLRQKNEEANVVPASTAVTPTAVTNNSTTVEPPSKPEKPQENTHETKDNTKEVDIAKPKKEESVAKEPAKPQDKSRPISSTPVPGTPWYI